MEDHDLAGPDPPALGRLERGYSPGPDYRRPCGAVFHAAPRDGPGPLHDDADRGFAGEIIDSLLPFTEPSPQRCCCRCSFLLD